MNNIDRRIAETERELKYFQEGLNDSPEIEEEIRCFREKLKGLREELAERVAREEVAPDGAGKR